MLQDIEKRYDIVIGLEVHAQLSTDSKLFSPASTAFGQEPNANTAPVCLGLPGTLPVLNEEAINMAIKAGFALNCKIRNYSVFARKNYYYADLPKGYQISQYDKPLCEHGFLDIDVNGSTKKIGVTRIHVEEDAGKLVHQGSDAIDGASCSFVDLNRAGVPLIEIVSEPDIHSIAEARAYLELLREILVHVDVCDGNMEEGSLRCDANVSLKPKGSNTLGTRTETKNLNSFRSLERALTAEIKRQAALLDKGETVIQETRNYNDATQSTTALRSKEDAHDYRYFPDPDIPPLILSDAHIQNIQEALPELPQVKRKRYADTLEISQNDIKVLLNDRLLDRFFQAACEYSAEKVAAKTLSNWIVGELSAQLKNFPKDVLFNQLSPESFSDLVQAVSSGKIASNQAKAILSEVLKTGQAASTLIEKESAEVISDDGILKQLVEEIFQEDPSAKEKFYGSDAKAQSKVANFIMGQIMKKTKGKVKPDAVKAFLSTLS